MLVTSASDHAVYEPGISGICNMCSVRKQYLQSCGFAIVHGVPCWKLERNSRHHVRLQLGLLERRHRQFTRLHRSVRRNALLDARKIN